MASVIQSANRGTASVFDLVYTSANAANKVLRVASLAADTLDVKAREMHESVRSRSVSNIVIIRDREVMNAAREYVDLLEENYQYVTGLTDFNRITEYDKIVKKMELALDSEE